MSPCETLSRLCPVLTAPPTVWTPQPAVGTPCSQSPHTTPPHLDANHAGIGGFTAFLINKNSDVRWAIGPLQPPDASSSDHYSSNGKRCPSMQGIPVKLSGSHPIMVRSPAPKLGDVLSPVVREICFPVHVLSAAKTKCH